VILAPEARIIADATEIGDGGSIIVYGKETARINGQLTARGGPHGGDGGFVETSAAGTIEIAAEVEIDASAPAGEPGTWLIDPTDITIGIPDDPGTTVANTILESVLQTGNNVEVDTSQPPYGNASDSGAGNITVAASIQPNLTEVYGNQQVILTLTADNNVTINSGVTIGPTNTDAGSSMGVTITAGRNITNNGTIDVAAGLGGAVNLTAASNIALGRINAGAGDITLTAGGAITGGNSRIKEYGSEEENLVGGVVSLTTGGGIGASGDGDIDTAVTGIDAQTTSGGIFIAETDAVQLGNSQAVTAGGPIQVTSGNTLTVGQAVTTTGAGGTVGLTANAGDLVINDQTITASGAVDLTAANNVALGRVVAGSNAISVTATSGAISDAKAGEDAGNENLVGGNISLTAGSGIGGATGDADIDTAVTSINAQTTSGGIFIAETSNVTLGTVTTGSGGSSIEVIADGDMTVAQTVTTAGSGEIHLQATNSDLTVISGATVASANGKIRLATGSGALILEDASGASRRDDVYDASPTRGVIRTDNADIELASMI